MVDDVTPNAQSVEDAGRSCPAAQMRPCRYCPGSPDVLSPAVAVTVAVTAVGGLRLRITEPLHSHN
jgi:hypothetical protein